MPERYLGRTVGRFRIDSVVGSGGFAWVYRGYDPELDIPVAIKVLKPQFAGDETFELRFRAEASIAAKLRHPHIIRILAVGREGDAVYSVMDYLPHGLAERLHTMTALPEPLVVRIGLHVADALAFAHREGVIHRDIKPDNILFDAHGNAVVADFGIACAASGYARQTGTNMVVGTPQYFSPEQARGLPIDGRADVYSLGVTLFRSATGLLPFDGDDWYEIARQHVEDRPPKPRSLAPGMSAELERVILRCLAKDSDRRFPSAEALYEALAALPAAAADPARTRTLELAPLASSGPRRLGGRRGRGRLARRGAIAAGGALAALGIFAALFYAAGGRAPAAAIVRESAYADGSALPPIKIDGAAGALTPGGGVPPRPDSQVAASRDSEANTGALRVDAPPRAQISVDGIVVGWGSWRSDTLPPGRYEVTAVVRSVDKCPSARQTRAVTLAAGDGHRVTLRPIACGLLRLTAEPGHAVVAFTSLETGRRTEGRAGVRVPFALPEGRYSLRVAAPPPCSPYEDTLRVLADSVEAKRVALICK